MPWFVIPILAEPSTDEVARMPAQEVPSERHRPKVAKRSLWEIASRSSGGATKLFIESSNEVTR